MSLDKSHPSSYLDGMDSSGPQNPDPKGPPDVLQALDAELRKHALANPLAALERIVSIRELIAQREREAVQAAISNHTWRELGEALGVSKQAAFQRFGKEWASGIRSSLPRKELHQEIRRRLSS